MVEGASWPHDHSFIFQVAALLSGLFPRFPGSLFCGLPLPLLPSNAEVMGLLKTLPLGHLVSLGKV